MGVVRIVRVDGLKFLVGSDDVMMGSVSGF